MTSCQRVVQQVSVISTPIINQRAGEARQSWCLSPGRTDFHVMDILPCLVRYDLFVKEHFHMGRCLDDKIHSCMTLPLRTGAGS